MAWLMTLPVLAVLAIPWVLAVAATFAHLEVQRRLLAAPGTVDRPAEAWLRAAARGLGTRIEVHSALPASYFPQVDTIGLPHEAAASLHPIHRAMVAHELGHARVAATHAGLRAAMPIARLLASAAPFATAAAFVVVSIGQHAWAVPFALALLATTAAAHTVVVADEAAASWLADRALRADRALSSATLAAARRGLLAALAAYAAPCVGWVALLAASPALVGLALHGHALPPAEPLDATGAWMVLFLSPFLLLQAGLVLAETVRPEPVASAFQLALRQERGQGWGFIGGLCAFAIAVPVAGWSDAPGFRIAVGLALFTAMQPLTVLLRAVVVTAVVAVAGLLGLDVGGAATVPGTGRELHAPRALAALFERPGVALRVARLAQLAWVPLLVGVAWVVAAG